MKRFVRVVALVLVFSCFFVSVSADEVTSPWVNLLDYDTGNDSGNYLEFVSSGSLFYETGFDVYARSFQGLVQTAGSALTNIYLTRASTSTVIPCTLVNVGNGLYRFYTGTVSAISDGFRIHFENNGSGTTYLTVLSFEYSSLRSFQYSEIGSISGSGGGLSTTKTVTMANSSSMAHFQFLDGTGEAEFGYSALFFCNNWRKYDFLDYYIEIRTLEFDSFSAFCGTSAVPIEVSDFYYALNGQVRVMVRLDLRNINRSTTDVPYLRLTGTSTPAGQNDLYLLSVSGVVSFDESDSMLFYFRSLESHLSSLFDSMAQRQEAYHSDLEEWNIENQQNLCALFDSVTDLLSDISADIKSIHSTLLVEFDSLIDKLTSVQNGIVSKLNNLETTMVTWFTTVSDQLDQLLHPDTSNSEEFEDDIASQATEMADISETLDSVTKPPLEELDPSVDDIVSPDDIENYTSILGILLGNSIFLSVCLMSFTLTLVSYTLYGKR